ncbi:DEAD/DEAH box helicase [Naumannella halotolerans]|uniref:Superfamily II DNA/RNA helicase n=1 Tax=Naumannella halotolerans TaxID=993414 RepID=A0A4R7J7L7_9ACTN|nr:DEAD/DEAH box helicase [Naumannella halotolerans]TDT33441.1 superfamily II DNA/RNA helicase [Naumannella halotolerans]
MKPTLTNDFSAFGLPKALITVLDERRITEPTPIQAATLPDSVQGRDVLGRGRTGSGKTYGFALPLVARLAESSRGRQPKRPRAMILAPTRELATQIDETVKPLAEAVGLRTQTIFGGVGQGPQVKALQAGVEIIIACPGRLEDLVDQGHAVLDRVEITVLDEADHMADLGFLPGVTRLLQKTPANGQRMFFSATLDRGVDSLVKKFLRDPAVHHADSPQASAADIDHHVLQLRPDARLDVLVDLAAAPGRRVIFTRTKFRAKSLTRQLNARGVAAVELHGNLSQNARTRSMDAFHSGRVETLVATDIAARGIHVDDVELVIHADPPVEHKAYVHRSGRTARAGRHGTVVTLMLPDQVSDVRSLTKAAGIRPTITKVDGTDAPILRDIAPGDRVVADRPVVVEHPGNPSGQATSAGGQGARRSSGGGNRRRRGGQGGSRNGGPQKSGAASSGQRSSGGQSAGGQRGRRRSGNDRPKVGAGSGHSAASFSRSSRSR